MNEHDWCELRFLVMSVIALVGLWHIYLVRVPEDWRSRPTVYMQRMVQQIKRKVKR